MLYYVEQGVKYTLAYGDIDELFYESIESVYEDALDLIKENNLYDQFYARCKKVMIDTNGMVWYGMGWDGDLAIILRSFLRSIIKNLEPFPFTKLFLTDKEFVAYI